MKYQVKVAEVYTTVIDVEAESEQEAQAKAEELLAIGCYPNGEEFEEVKYDYTLDRDQWVVWEN